VSFTEILLPRLEYYRVLRDRWGLYKAQPQPVDKTASELRIADLENSLSWRITAPLRRAGAIYLRLAGRLPGKG
jgi:hypothetical protein